MKEPIAEDFRAVEEPAAAERKEAMAAIGACKGCPPARATLFGNVKDGACTDRCRLRKMNVYFAWRIKRNPDLVLVSTMYDISETANVSSETNTTAFMPLVQWHDLKYTSRGYETPVRELAERAGKDGKVRMIFQAPLADLLSPQCGALICPAPAGRGRPRRGTFAQP